MSIEIFQLEKIPWDNGGYLFPNALPTKFKDRKTVKKRPAESNYYGGTITLIGGHWNWCKYNGQYYFLKKLKPISVRNKEVKQQRWLYAVIRDNWVNNVLLGKVIIKGDVAGWRIEKDIRENLNKVSLTIENPVGVARVCFKEEESTWRNVLRIASNTKLINSEFSEIFLNKKRLNKIVEKVQVIDKYKKIKPYLYSRRNDIFIFGQLKPTYTFSRWKTKVADLVNKAVIDLAKDPKAFIGKVTYAQGENKLLNHYCFTYEGSAIGSKDNSVQINQIDLSNVTDIRRVSWQDLYTNRIDNLFTIDSALIDIDVVGSTEEQEEKVYKISQRNFLPLGQDVLKNKWNVDKYLSDNWENKNPGQKLTINKSQDNEATFYFVDQINYFLSWYLGSKYVVPTYAQNSDFRWNVEQFLYWRYGPQITVDFISTLSARAIYHNKGEWYRRNIKGSETHYGYSPRTEEVSSKIRKETLWTTARECQNLKNKLSNVTKQLQFYDDRFDDTERFENDKYPAIEVTTPNVFPHIPFNTTSGKNEYLWNKLEVSPSYGILLWQVSRPREKWELFKYIGKTTTKTLQVFNGIDSSELFDLYGSKKDDANKEWWRRVDQNHPLSKFTGQLEFARMFLDFWQLNFLHFFPSPADENNYELEQGKCYFEDKFYQVDKFLTSTKRCETYQVLNNQTLKDLDNTPVPNPWNEDDIDTFSKGVEQKINKVFLKEDLELPRPLEYGDYLISSLEYKWDNYDYSHWCTNLQDLSNLDKNSWEIQTFSLLEDFVNLNPGTKRDIDIETEIGWKDKNSAQIFVGTDLNGDIDFYTCWRYEKEHQLSNNPNQYITSVDGKISERVTYYHLRKWETKIDTISKATGVIDILANFYSNVGGKKVTRSEDGSKFFWDVVPINEIDNPEGNLFDLVGSDWYAFIRKGKVHLIAKPTNPSFVKPLEKKTQSFVYPEDGGSTQFTEDGIKSLKDLPIAAKANQICTLYYKGYPITIRTKFLFDNSEHDSRPIGRIEGIKTEDNSTYLDYFNFSFHSSFDTVEEIIKIPKEPTSGQAIADQLAIDQARENARRIAIEDEVQRYQLGLNQRIDDSSERRSKFDLSLQEFYKRLADQFSVTGVISTGISNAVSTLVGVGAGAIGGAAVGVGSGLLTKGISGVTAPFTNAYISGNVTNAPKNNQGIPQLERLAPWLQTQETIKNQVFYDYEMKEKTERITEDRRFKYQQTLLNSYSIQLTHYKRQFDNVRTLNRLAHNSIKEPINDAFLNKKWRESKGLNEFYMVVKYPKGEQLEQLQAYIDEFGYDVDIPNKVITLRSGMAPNVIRMRNIAGDEVSGISDILERDYLIKLLERGIKIYSMEESENKEYDYFETSIYLPKFSNYDQVVAENEHLKERVNELEHTHVLETKENQQLRRFLLNKLEDEITDIPKLQADIKDLENKETEVKAAPEKYDEKALDLLNEVKTTLSKRLKIAQDIDTKTKEQEREKEEAKKRAETLQVEKDKAEDERNKCREELANAHNKERSLINENEALHKNLEGTLTQLKTEKAVRAQKEKEVAEKQKQIDKLDSDLKRCKANLAKQKTSASRNVRGWTYCDFLKTFNDLNWDWNEMYKLLKSVPLYGLSTFEFYRLEGPTKLQAIEQIVDECTDLQDNNTSFLSSLDENNNFRQFLTFADGIVALRNIKKSFVVEWAKMWNFKKSQNEYIDRKSWDDKIKHSAALNKKPSFDFPNKQVWRPEAGRLLIHEKTMWNINNDWTNRKEPFWKKKDHYFFHNTFYNCIKWVQLRNSGVANDYDQGWKDGNVIYYKPGYYDFYSNANTPALALWNIARFLEYYSDKFEAIYSIIAKKNSPGQMFNEKPNNFASLYCNWKYEGFSTRRMFIGYVLHLIKWASQREVNHQKEFIHVSKFMSPKTFTDQFAFMGDLSYETHELEEALYVMKVSYKALCERIPFEDAQAEVEEEFDQANAPQERGINRQKRSAKIKPAR